MVVGVAAVAAREGASAASCASNENPTGQTGPLEQVLERSSMELPPRVAGGVREDENEKRHLHHLLAVAILG